MTISRLKVVLAASVAVAALAGCGSSNDDDGGTGGGTAPPPPPAATTDVPASAQADAGGLVAYLRSLIANSTNETGSPILVGTAVLPTSETAEPTP